VQILSFFFFLSLLRWTIPFVGKTQVQKDSVVEITIYHHTLHMWYKVVYIGGTGIIENVLSQWHKQNI
jgi:hypothetical protein